MKISNFNWIASLFLLLIFVGNSEALDIKYHIGWVHPNSHFLHVSMKISRDSVDSLDVSLPAWRPGRYVIQDYVRNLIAFKAQSTDQHPLRAKQIDKDTWRIYKKPEQDVVVEYDYYARQLDGGSSYLDDSEAYINPVTSCMYIENQEMHAVGLTLKQPDDWKIAGALNWDEKSESYVFENYHELVDTPIIVSPDFQQISFDYKGAQFEIILQGDANFDRDSLKIDIEKIVSAQIDMMQDIPFKKYWFLYHLLPKPMGHGVEHKNSTSIAIGPADFTNKKFYRGFLGVTSHEFFHAWNVERIRPKAIYYPDYSKENYTTTFWIFEGFTSYYGNLILEQTGLVTMKKYLQQLAGQIKRYEKTYGTKVTPVSAVSWDSWTKSYGEAPPNTYYSFYLKGSLLALILDLEIRHETKNKKSLNDVMRYLNIKYALTDTGIPETGLQKAVETVTGKDFSNFFARYVNGVEQIDFQKYLLFAGLELTRKSDMKDAAVYLGIETKGDERQTVISNVIPESPAFNAGLDLDDILIAINGRRTYKKNLDLNLQNYLPGDTVKIAVFRRENLIEIPVVLGKNKPSKFEINELKKSSGLQSKIFKSWMNVPD